MGRNGGNMRPVILYTAPGCAPCERIKDFFMKHDIPYIEANVTVDVVGEHLAKEGIMSVPAIKYGDDNYIIGYDEEVMKRELLG